METDLLTELKQEHDKLTDKRAILITSLERTDRRLDALETAIDALETTPTHEATSEAPGPDSEGGEGDSGERTFVTFDEAADMDEETYKTLAAQIHQDEVGAEPEAKEFSGRQCIYDGDPVCNHLDNHADPSTGGEEDGPLANSPTTSAGITPDSSTPENSACASETSEETSASSDSDLSISLDTGEASPFVSDGETDTPVQEGPTRFRESNWEDELKAAGRAARAQGKARWFNPYGGGRGGNAKASDLWLEGYDEQAASESANAVKEEA